MMLEEQEELGERKGPQLSEVSPTATNNMEEESLALEGGQEIEARRRYEQKVREIMAHIEGKAKQASGPELEELREETDKAHKLWVDSRKRRALLKKALEGRDQKRRKVQFWRKEVSTYMDRIILERGEEDWYTDRYWGLIPTKVNQAEQRCREYEKMIAEFLPTAGKAPGSGSVHLQSCPLCGEIILGKGDKENSMALHRHHAHWTEI